MALNQVGLERLGTSVTDKIGENKNLIINGAMQLSQRGTSFADSANGSYTLDRFNIQNSSGTPAFTVTQDSDAPHGFNNSLKVACTTADTSPAAGSFSRIRHTIEAQNLSSLAKGTASAKAQTLSFYVKTNKTGVYTVFVYDDDNNRMFSASYTVSDTNWNRYTIDVPADTSGAINDDNGAGYVIHWGLSLGSNRTSGSLASTWATYATANEHVGNVNFADNTSNVWAITGVQLEVGSVATDFEHRSFADNLLLCQRYYTSGDDKVGTTSYPSSDGYARGWYSFKVNMRATPTMTFSDGGTGGSKIADGISDKGFYVTYGSLSASQAGTYDWTASAEL
jgi:L-rhamnose mutarotase